MKRSKTVNDLVGLLQGPKHRQRWSRAQSMDILPLQSGLSSIQPPASLVMEKRVTFASIIDDQLSSKAPFCMSQPSVSPEQNDRTQPPACPQLDLGPPGPPAALTRSITRPYIRSFSAFSRPSFSVPAVDQNDDATDHVVACLPPPCFSCGPIEDDQHSPIEKEQCKALEEGTEAPFSASVLSYLRQLKLQHTASDSSLSDMTEVQPFQHGSSVVFVSSTQPSYLLQHHYHHRYEHRSMGASTSSSKPSGIRKRKSDQDLAALVQISEAEEAESWTYLVDPDELPPTGLYESEDEIDDDDDETVMMMGDSYSYDDRKSGATTVTPKCYGGGSLKVDEAEVFYY